MIQRLATLNCSNVFPKFSNPTPPDEPLFLSFVLFRLHPRGRYLRCSTSSDCSFCSRCSNHHHLFVAGRNPRVDLNSINIVRVSTTLSVRTATSASPSSLVFEATLVSSSCSSCPEEESFGMVSRSSSSLLVSLKSVLCRFSSKDKFRTPSLREEGAFEFVPPIGVLFFSFSRGILRFSGEF